eukprot:m.307640 g.307640  ORF g.307640 m.307640 type:complete len:299 (+) comp42571_c0_seq1:102-998(+)
MPFGKSSKGFKVANDPTASEKKPPDRRETKMEKGAQMWLHTKEAMLSGVVFDVEYLGNEAVKEPTGRQNSSEIIERLILKRQGKQVSLQISANGLKVVDDDFDSDHPMKFVQMYRISFTTTDKIRRRVFFFIARDRQTKQLLLHVLYCKTKRQASEITLTAAQGFQIAFESFQSRDPEAKQLLKERAQRDEMQEKSETDNSDAAAKVDISRVKRRSKKVSVVLHHRPTGSPSAKDALDIDGKIDLPDDDIREEYKRMTILRENPDLPDMDVDPDDFNDDVALFLAGGLTAEEMAEKRQ